MRESWYYPPGCSPNDPHIAGYRVYYNCEECGDDICENDRYVNFDGDCYCKRCAVEIFPEEGDKCEICGREEKRLWQIGETKVCMRCFSIETAGEEW